jgi:hypothetical protein
MNNRLPALVTAVVLFAPSVGEVATTSRFVDQPAYDIAFVAKSESGGGIFVMRGGESSAVLVRAVSDALLLPSSWSPDGKRIAYSSFGPEDEELLAKFMEVI